MLDAKLAKLVDEKLKPFTDSDFVQVWYAVLGRYDAEHIDKSRYDAVMSNVVKVLYNSVKRNPKLAAAAGKGATFKRYRGSHFPAADTHKGRQGTSSRFRGYACQPRCKEPYP